MHKRGGLIIINSYLSFSSIYRFNIRELFNWRMGIPPSPPPPTPLSRIFQNFEKMIYPLIMKLSVARSSSLAETLKSQLYVSVIWHCHGNTTSQIILFFLTEPIIFCIFHNSLQSLYFFSVPLSFWIVVPSIYVCFWLSEKKENSRWPT